MTERKEIEGRLRAAVEAGAAGELPRLVAVEAARLAGLGFGPATLVEAVAELGRPDLAPLAAELHARAAAELARDAQQQQLAERSPVFVAGDAVVALPVGEPAEEARGRIADRVLALAARSRSRRVRLVLGFAGGAGREPGAWSALAVDLAEQGIELETEQEI